MSLWVDKYRPKTLKSLNHSDDLTHFLLSLSQQSRDLPHLLLYGPNGSGKKTRCMSLLAALFGQGVYRLKIDVRQFVTPSNRKLELNVVSSPYHLEITPSDMGNNDRIVIQELLKEVAQMEQVDFQDSKGGLAHRYKCVVINEADSLTRDAQAALRRTMEKYSKNIRLIMVCDSMSSIIAPIKSRCLLVRCPAPTNSDIIKILSEVATEEKVELESGAILNIIAKECDGNLRVALLMLESMALNNEMHLKNNTTLIKPDWKVVIIKTANKIQRERSVGSLVECRTILYDLLSHCIPAKVILQELMSSLLASASLDDSVKINIVEASSIFDERLSLGNKAIYHLEGFVAKVMCIIDGQ
ncbi:similar to Saccharomyces cerevisiae YBR087W RFC5 Subunit of heteropentameric Replication factor C (RF-C) [Maudiozyma barnettii]|uniref:Replication factor C subunit 5 n=1 Tax=Maudiozyma barnettii TaxID=61262 RepID=A0A8H2VD97_9SACH|nr:replication factor C subunit 5 [Kazachstania barnettii]CAB4253092.1 similar to Saccharomyces cerevisiae YBR087W RFC5 Subunit of heteropentameric Replication factor C (RF-C) [Kazachstania barnettii]CAD1780373.1 similar to Saccharomyces cerevisiae YBR087W RFC5 Subunit of heteropentameric Replication factor C (RF-C) [Kazachstania barnettii]